MKKNMNKIFGIFIAASLTANCGIGIVHAESGILSISDTKTIISLNEKENYVEGTFGDSALEDLGGVVFTSDNENVLTVDEYGEIIEKNYGSATVTASYEGASASVLITVTPENLANLIDTRYGNNGVIFAPEYGETYNFNGGYADSTRIKLANMSWANWGGYTGISYENTLQQAWFYDNGQSEASEAGLQFAAYWNGGGGQDSNGGTGVIGVLKSADASYRISNILLRNPGTGNTDLTVEHLSDEKSTDTGIARTKGWHQVSLLNAKDSNGSVIFKLYFDGQLIKVYNGWSAFPGIINMYAGTDSSHVAQFKMPNLVEYHELSDVTVSAGANGITASYEYNGNAPVASYQWYEADSADSTDWTAIEGANEAVYANANESKYYRVGVKISDTTPRKGTAFVTNEVYSAPLSIKDIELSISSTKSAVALDEEGNKVSVMYGNTDISGSSEISYSSDNEDVLTVSENGEIIEKNYGSAKVTASYKGKTVSMLITVTPENLANLIDTGYRRPDGTVAYPNYEDIREFNGGYADSTRIKLANMSWANWGGYTGISYENTLQQAWFYDNGQSEASEAGLQFAAYWNGGGGQDSNGGTGVIGVLKSADASYRISNILLRNPGTGNTDLTVEHLSDEKSTDTGIARTKGWHQVSLLNAKDSNGSVIFKLYFDGQLIKVYNGWSAFPGIINMYAGTDSSHVAQFKMPNLVEYHELSDVTVSAGANGITASYEYNGNAPVASYQWYEADSADSTDWTAIEGANEAVYANANESKYYRVGVKISDTTPRKGTAFVTNEVYSAPFKYTRVEETSLSYQNGTVTVSAKDAISNGVLIITSYNENDGYKTLADVKFQAVNCAAYSSVNIQVGDLTGGHKIMLWNSLSDMVPYCPATTVGN